VTIHASWATPGADIYLVPTQEARHALEKCKIPSSKIIDTGFPIHPKFALCDLDQQQARQQLSIDNNRFTILATGGGVGAGNMNDWINAMEKHCSNAQILVVTGNNKALFQELQKRRTHSLGLHAYGFVNNMETLMAASDVIVSKAGPGTIMEGVSMKRPLIITEAVGLQETGNIDYVKQNNLGYHCSNPVDACEIINTIASRPYDDSAYHNKAIVFDGAMRIAQIIFQHIDARNSEPQKDSKASLGA
jgi:UDP-N-acetylglucosamine:LPS N-acetylglucosamine transferase